MARKDYTVGKVSVEGNTVGQTTSAGLTMTGEDWDITAIGDDNPAMQDITETFEIQITANYDPTDAGQQMIRNKFIGGSRTLTSCAYYEDDSKYISGSGIVTACSLTKSVGSFDQLTATIRSSGTWSYT